MFKIRSHRLNDVLAAVLQGAARREAWRVAPQRGLPDAGQRGTARPGGLPDAGRRGTARPGEQPGGLHAWEPRDSFPDEQPVPHGWPQDEPSEPHDSSPGELPERRDWLLGAPSERRGSSPDGLLPCRRGSSARHARPWPVHQDECLQHQDAHSFPDGRDEHRLVSRGSRRDGPLRDSRRPSPGDHGLR